MTGTLIQDALFNMQNPVNPGMKQAAVKDGEFSEMFAKQTNDISKPTETAKSDRADAEPTEKTDVRDLTRKNSLGKKTEIREKTNDTPKTAEDVTEEEMTEAADLVSDVTAQLVQVIAQVFEQEPVQVEAAMTELDLEPVDLLDNQKLTDFMQELTGVKDSMELLTDENLYKDFKQVIAAADSAKVEIADAVDLPKEEISNLLEKLSELAKTDDRQDKSKDLPLTQKTAEVVDYRQNEKNQDAPKIQIVRENMTDMQQANPVSNPDTENNFEQQQPETQVTQENKATKKTEEKGQAPAEQNISPFKEAFLPRETDAVMEARTESYSQVRAEDIMKQIMDFMKVTVKEDMSSMELQLHPASLGNVQVHIANKAGTVTAQFVTQNETVQAALESQMIQLQERFEEQGIKVGAIEVTVQTNSFQENLEQGNNGQNATDESAKAKPARRIRLDASMTEEELELLGEEERLAVSMMEANGNTVDYMA